MRSLSLLQEIFLTQESNWGSPALQVDSLPTELSGKPTHCPINSAKLKVENCASGLKTDYREVKSSWADKLLFSWVVLPFSESSCGG